MKRIFILLTILILLFNCSKKTLENKTGIETKIIENIILEDNFIEIKNSSNEIKHNYNNGNGTILEQRKLNGKNWTIIKHETYNKYIGWKDFNVYENLGQINDKILFVLTDRMIVSTLEIAFSEERESDFELWVKIKNDKGNIGWIETDGYYNQYDDGKWSILEEKEIDGKIMTVRKLEQYLDSTARLNVRDEPSLSSNILFQLESQTSVNTLAIIEETVTIDSIKDHWVKIENAEGKIGWIFGGYTDIQKGGPKYSTPENRVSLELSPP